MLILLLTLELEYGDWLTVRKRFFGKNLKILLGAILVALNIGMAVFAPFLAPYDPYQQDLMHRLQPPVWSDKGTWDHLLGTDNYGRDMLSRLIHGSRISMLVGLSAMLFSGVLGSILGMLAGYLGGRTELVIMRVADAQFALPNILLAILIVASIGGSTLNLILVLGISGWVIYARVAFGLMRSFKERAFVQSVVALGARDTYIIFRHILPHMIPVLTVVSTLQVAQMILRETALSFLGLGVPPPTPTWGNMLAEGRNRLWVAPWIANYSGIAIILVVWGINMLGDGLREHFDPRAKEARK